MREGQVLTREAMIVNADRTGILVMLAALGIAIALVLGSIVMDHHDQDRPDACACECR